MNTGGAIEMNVAGVADMRLSVDVDLVSALLDEDEAIVEDDALLKKLNVPVSKAEGLFGGDPHARRDIAEHGNVLLF